MSEGRWIPARDNLTHNPYECSVCGFPGMFNPPPKCPCCGAEMYGPSGKSAEIEEEIRRIKESLGPVKIEIESSASEEVKIRVKGDAFSIGAVLSVALGQLESTNPELKPVLEAACRSYLMCTPED